MDDIIDSDEDVANFVKLSGNTPLDGTAATHDEMNQMLADKKSDITIIPERNSPHLAQVQVTIQRLCIKSIAEKSAKMF